MYPICLTNDLNKDWFEKMVGACYLSSKRVDSAISILIVVKKKKRLLLLPSGSLHFGVNACVMNHFQEKSVVCLQHLGMASRNASNSTS